MVVNEILIPNFLIIKYNVIVDNILKYVSLGLLYVMYECMQCTLRNMYPMYFR